MKSEYLGAFRRMLVPILCAVFFVLAMALALMGSSVYRNTIAAADDNYEHRTALSYLVNQIRRSDRINSITVGDFGGYNALALSDDCGYINYIYCIDGQLCELYTEPNSGMMPSDGTNLLPLNNLEISVENGGLTLSADGNTVTVRPRCGVLEVPKL